jgi:hypothetical protein
MALVQINKNPSRRDLLVFTLMLPIFFGLVGALRWHAGSTKTATALWSSGIALSLVLFAAPSARRWVYLGWMYVTFPVAWTVSHAILALMYFVVASPVALLLRALGRDPMERKLDKAAKSYWVTREANVDTKRYFRQF